MTTSRPARAAGGPTEVSYPCKDDLCMALARHIFDESAQALQGLDLARASLRRDVLTACAMMVGFPVASAITDLLRGTALGCGLGSRFGYQVTTGLRPGFVLGVNGVSVAVLILVCLLVSRSSSVVERHAHRLAARRQKGKTVKLLSKAFIAELAVVVFLIDLAVLWTAASLAGV
jgi:hypothetical protein